MPQGVRARGLKLTEDYTGIQGAGSMFAARRSSSIGGLQPISRDTDNNAATYNCWWTNKRS